MERYTWALIDFVLENKINASCAEVDCQKVLGVEKAWYYRRLLRDKLPDNRIINIFHLEDGQNGLDRLIEYSDYLAISVPELRLLKPKTYKDDTLRLSCYIKKRKPEIDIHLLGCTEKTILRECRFCTTCDSTSWKSINKHGQIMNEKTSNIHPEKMSETHNATLEMMQYCGIEKTDARMKYYGNYFIGSLLLKKEYTRIAGDQN